MKKFLVIISPLLFFSTFIFFVIPNYLGIPIAAYQAYEMNQAVQKEYAYNEFDERQALKIIDSVYDFPAPLGAVSDFENVFSSNQISDLTKIINDYEQKTTREIAIVTVESIEPYKNIAIYSTDLANEWKIGKAKKNNGLLILFSKNLREIRITTGYGTEKILTDEVCKKVIDETIIPEFKKGDYYSGIKEGLTALIKKWK